jgi:putative flavoprotein involved in K+ transport
VPRTTAIVIGGGQAGLAMSHCLSDAGIDHVVLERGRIANRWRTHGWDSLRLLTPNWMTRLPGYRYDGADPDGFMTIPEVVRFLEQYARASRAPVMTSTTVRRVDRWGDRFRVATTRGAWCASSVVIATGHSDLPAVPAVHRRLVPWIEQIVPSEYRHPEQLPPGGVLVVGASATGIQIADELQQSGRHVTLAAGQHTRLPRTYRGRDILWWLDRLGVLGQDASQVHDLEISRQQPSLQLVGRPDRATLNLGVLARRGVRVVGRLRHIDGHRVTFDEDLLATAAAADFKLAGVLMRVDAFIAASGITASPPERFEPTWPHFADSETTLDLKAERIGAVVWATGYRRSYPWLHVPVLDQRGEIQHQGGITEQPGLYVLGLNFLRRRNSSFIDGVGADARDLTEHLARHVGVARIA